MPLLTEEQFKEVLPPQLKKSVNPALMAQVNQTLSDPEIMETFKEGLISYASVMQEGRFKVSSYINAVKYISFKLMGKTNIAAYSLTFPDKIQDFKNRGVSKKDISSYASAYNKSKLVNLIFEQTLIPIHIFNAPALQKAINTQVELMLTANSEKVRCDAANSVLTHLKPPETKKMELDITGTENKVIDTLRETTLALVEQQKEMMKQGQTAKDIAEGALIVVRD